MLKKKTYTLYSKDGTLENKNFYEKVLEEIKIWSVLFNENIIRLYEVTTNYDSDFVYLTTEYAKFGAIADYNVKLKKIQRNTEIYDKVLEFLIDKDSSIAGESKL